MDLFEDLFGEPGPNMGYGILVTAADICVDDIDELGDAVHGKSPELPVVELTEEAFREIEPRGAGGNEAEEDARMSFEPATHFIVLVCKDLERENSELK